MCLNLWTSICLCLVALFTRASTHILRAFHSADIGIITDTTSSSRSTCVVLALTASAAFKSQVLLNLALEMHFKCIAQPDTTLLECALYLKTSMIQAYHQALQINASLGTCILRSDLSRVATTADLSKCSTTVHITRACWNLATGRSCRR